MFSRVPGVFAGQHLMLYRLIYGGDLELYIVFHLLQEGDEY